MKMLDRTGIYGYTLEVRVRKTALLLRGGVFSYVIGFGCQKAAFLILNLQIAQDYCKAVIVKENEIFLMFC